MKTFIVSITQIGKSPRSLSVIAHSSCEALRAALSTMSAPGRITARPA